MDFPVISIGFVLAYASAAFGLRSIFTIYVISTYSKQFILKDR